MENTKSYDEMFINYTTKMTYHDQQHKFVIYFIETNNIVKAITHNITKTSLFHQKHTNTNTSAMYTLHLL